MMENSYLSGEVIYFKFRGSILDFCFANCRLAKLDTISRILHGRVVLLCSPQQYQI